MSVTAESRSALKLRKTDTAIEYHDGERWQPLYEGEPAAISNTWQMVQLGFCNDDLIAIIHNNKNT